MGHNTKKNGTTPTDNELLRESGIYWYNIRRPHYKDIKD